MTVGQSIAVAKKAKEQAPVVAAKLAKQQSEQGQNPSIQRAKKNSLPVVTERWPEAIEKQAKPAQAERKSISPVSPKRHRRTKVHRKKTSNAVVQPRTDLMYHGMLETR